MFEFHIYESVQCDLCHIWYVRNALSRPRLTFALMKWPKNTKSIFQTRHTKSAHPHNISANIAGQIDDALISLFTYLPGGHHNTHKSRHCRKHVMFATITSKKIFVSIIIVIAIGQNGLPRVHPSLFPSVSYLHRISGGR